MDDFPQFMRSSANRIATQSQATPGVEGYVFDGVDGSQMAFWTLSRNSIIGRTCSRLRRIHAGCTGLSL